MTREFSLYLDVVRFLAACLVVIYHTNDRLIIQDHLPFSGYGHASVIVFFVLSGYVIAYISEAKEHSPKLYISARLARVYSVAIPVVLLTPILDIFGRQLYPELYVDRSPFDHPIIRLGSSLMFANEMWVSIMSFSNTPYWSLCYEVWYYLLFGIYLFTPARLRLLFLIIASTLAGPKVMLLAPIWIIGVILHRAQSLKQIGLGASLVLALGSALGIVFFHTYQLTEYFSYHLLESIIGAYWFKQLAFSKFFLGDYLLGILVFAHLLGMRQAATYLGPLLLKCKLPIKTLSSYTFTLYLSHQPLYLFWGAVIHSDNTTSTYYIKTISMLFVSVLILGYFTENKRNRLKSWIYNMLPDLRGSTK